MKNGRREFIKAGALGAAVAATGLPAISSAGEKQRQQKLRKPLDILMLGGTGFIGPHMVREALAPWTLGHALQPRALEQHPVP